MISLTYSWSSKLDQRYQRYPKNPCRPFDSAGQGAWLTQLLPQDPTPQLLTFSWEATICAESSWLGRCANPPGLAREQFAPLLLAAKCCSVSWWMQRRCNSILQKPFPFLDVFGRISPGLRFFLQIIVAISLGVWCPPWSLWKFQVCKTAAFCSPCAIPSLDLRWSPGTRCAWQVSKTMVYNNQRRWWVTLTCKTSGQEPSSCSWTPCNAGTLNRWC